ncbi:T9SS type A sorting domain-containing protein [Urechidicola croceus]|uniref:Secretion system C-terminal sorting domain-containing protein n=1 Tax=Urechidicola croceus TaxID=1850246 RepID=A0A1D8P6L1_9FLAO|nr:T9SS type A sorting domain-containing protein [Urechidicola croceus]AOW20208.1 hypothetical protein LPB138_05740 [Urechidicola croceus]
MKKSIPILVIMLMILNTGYTQTNIKTMFYNLLYYPSGNPQNRELILKDILDTYQPDIFTVCELETREGADEILTESIQESTPNFARAEFISNQSDNSEDNQLQQMIFYNTDKFILERQQTHTTYIRDINQYTLVLNTESQETNPIKIEYFVAHFKSSDGTANKQIRLDMANVYSAILETLDPEAYVIFSGDFNLYTSSEPAYHEILDPTNNIVMVDPINSDISFQSWHNNESYSDRHTQATRVNQLNGVGAYSGMDDRFDFTFISENLTTSSDLHYVSDTYKAYGNNQNCYNLDINDLNCTGIFSQSLRDDLYLMSDHLPVVMELFTPHNTLSLNEYSTQDRLEIIGTNLIEKNLTLRINNNLFNSQLYIYNQLGQLVKTISTKSESQISIDVSNLTNGIYVIKSSNNEFVNPIKFFKTH